MATVAINVRTERIAVSNRVLASFAADTTIAFGQCDRNLRIEWTTYRGEIFSRQWMTRGQDFYPVWYRKWTHGGTACVALAQLVRWIRGKPVLPIRSWRWWSQETVNLLPASAVDELLAGGYPEHAPCVLCGVQLLGGFDWWNLCGVSGPCCHWANGCRQKPD